MVKNQRVRNVFVFMFGTGKYFKFYVPIRMIKFCDIWQSPKKFRMKIHDVFQLSRIKLRKMMDSFYVKIWDRKREQRQALGSNDSSILLAHNAWTAALYMFTLHICSLHQLSSSCVLICWSGTLKITVSWLEISIWSGQSLLMKVRHCWILLFPWPRT